MCILCLKYYDLLVHGERTESCFCFLQDCSDTFQLLGHDNIDEGRLWDYAVEAAAWSTELPKLDFAVSCENMIVPDIGYCSVVQSL